MSFFSPAIIPGGLTPVAQPLNNVINKVFKAYFRDLYDMYIISAPIMPNGSPKSPLQTASSHLGCGSLGKDPRRAGPEVLDIMSVLHKNSMTVHMTVDSTISSTIRDTSRSSPRY